MNRQVTNATLNTVEVVGKLALVGLKYTPEEIATLAKLQVFPDARKDARGLWQIPQEDVNLFIKRQERKKQLIKLITASTILTLLTVLSSTLSGLKDSIDLLSEYILPKPQVTATTIIPSPQNIVSVKQMLFSFSDSFYRLEPTVENAMDSDILVTGLSLYASYSYGGMCSPPPPRTFEFLDVFRISSAGESNLQFEGSVVDNSQDEFEYPVKGSLFSGSRGAACFHEELNLEFDISFVLPSKQYSTFYIMLLRQLKLADAAGVQSIPSKTFPYEELTLNIHTDRGIVISYTLSPRDLDATKSP